MSNFGLIQPTLIQQIKKILDQYPDDGQILKELIQNAEDARAKEVRFLYDHHSYGTEHLHHPGLAKFQGPALYAYNDAKFTDNDWKGVGMLCDSIKEKDPTKVGRFGLGFKSVFHMTDLPSVISGDSLGIIDPHEKYFSDEDGKRSGRRWHLETDRETMQKISDQFAPYKGIFNCTDVCFNLGSYDGTLFRLPLRKETSKLSETVYSQEKMKGLFECFEKDAHLILLFLMNLERIEVYERDANSLEPRKLFHVGISSSCLADVRKAREEFSAKVQENIWALSDGCFNEVKKTYPLSIETVHYHDGKTQGTRSEHSFVVTNLFSGNDVSQTLRALIGDKSLSYMPWVGVALPFTSQLYQDDVEEPQGHLFCFLPLPLENKSLTGLPVHVNGFFALSQNRRHLKWPSADQDEAIQPLTDKSLLWNKGLLNEVLPKAYAELVLQATSRLPKENAYGAWPDVHQVDVKWRAILQPLFRILLKSKVLHSNANGGVWCKVDEVLLDDLGRNNQSRKIVIDVLNRAGRKVVTVPVNVKTALKRYYPTIEYVLPRVLRSSLKADPSCYSNLSHKDKILLLMYVLSDSGFKNLKDIELLPLSDKTFTTFRKGSDPIYIDSCEHPKSLLPRLQGMFLDTEIDTDITVKLKNAAKKGYTQLRLFDNEVVELYLHQTLPPEWLDSEDPVTWSPGTSDQPTVEWLKELWLYFGRHFGHTESALGAFNGLPLIPVTGTPSDQSEVQLARIQQPSSLVLASLNGESIDESVCQVLKSLGLTILNDLPDCVQRYPRLVPAVANPASPRGVLGAIERLQNQNELFRRVRELLTEEIRSFRAFLSSISAVTSKEVDLLCNIPVFETFVGYGGEKSRFVSINEVKVGAPVDDLPAVSVFADVLDLRDHSSRVLAKILDTIPMTHIELMKMLLDDALASKYSESEADILVKYTLERFGIFHGEDFQCIKEKLQCLPFVVSSDYSRKKPSELFNPDDDLLRQIFIGEDVFPLESYYSQPEVNAHLKKLGLKQERNITSSDVLNSAKMVNEIQDVEKAVTKSEGLLKLVEKNPDILRERPRLRCIPWIPVLSTKPRMYSTCLPLKGCKNGTFASPNDVISHDFINLVGSVKLMVQVHKDSKVSEYFGWHQKPCTKDVLEHLKNVVLSYHVDDKSNFIIYVKDIYEYLANANATDVIRELKDLNLSKWVWNGDGFCSVSEAVLENPWINLAPYICMLPTETRIYNLLFTNCGMKLTCDSDLLLEVLFKIKERHESEPTPEHFEVKRDLQLAIDILNELKPENGEPFDNDIRKRLLVPIYVEGDSKLEMEPVEECTYCDREWLKQGHDMSDIDDTDDVKIKFIHQNIANSTAELLGVPSLMSRILGAEELELGESFGQFESLLDRLRGLLEGYTDGLSVPKELIQNADDAGATEVRFLYDERSNEDCMTRLIDEGMKECQGPALWAYNNAVFSDEDFQNVVKLNAATKKEDSRKIGRFGLGFNSVYNLTDVPSFVSRNYVVILDPHTTYLGKAIRDKSKPGIKMRMEEKKLRRLANQFKPYNGIFGCDLRPEEQPKSYNGTLFRFPLRTASQASKSGIKKLHYNDEQVKELLRILFHGAESLLLFTQNVLRVTVYHLRNEITEYQEPIELFRISKSCSKVIHRLESELSLSKPVQELAIEDQEFVNQSSILKASSSLMEDRLNGNFNSPPRVLLKSSMILKCQCTLSDDATHFGLDSEKSQVSWLVTSCMVSGEALDMSLRNRGLLPTAGVAAKLTELHSEKYAAIPITMSQQSDIHYQSMSSHNGNVFCFLPLPIHSGLPVHINGCFAVSDNRRYLRERTEEDKTDQGAEWNDVLMKEVVCQAYVSLLEDLKNLPSGNGYQFHSMWPRYCDAQTNCQGMVAQFYRSLFFGLSSLEDYSRIPELFSDGKKWSSIQNVVFLEPAFSSDERIGQVALDVMKTILESTNKIVVNLPEEIFQSFERYELQSEAQKRCYNKERFFREVFFPAICSVDASSRDKLVLYALDDDSEELRELIRSYRCIPSSPSGHQLKFPKELLHPNGKAAQLFGPEDERFPYGEEFTCEERLVKLKKLGMRNDYLDWNEVIERAESIKSLAPYHRGLERTKLILVFIDRKLNNEEQVDKDVQTRLQQVQFLPVMKKPKDFPLKWKGDEYTPNSFLSAAELYPTELKYLVCVSVPILDETKDGCGLLQWNVKTLLAMRKTSSLEQAKTQMENAITTAEDVENGTMPFDELKKTFDKLYDYFQSSLQNNKEEVVNFLMQLKFILGEKQTFSSNKVAFCTTVHYPPYLSKVLKGYELKFRELFKNAGVRECFEIQDYVQTLQQVKDRYGENPIGEELVQVTNVLNSLAEEMEKKCVSATEAVSQHGSIFIPDSNGIMKASKDVCVKDCYWMPNEPGVNYINERLTPKVGITLGANTRRQETLRKHTSGLPFGQKEKLTNRLKRILTGYPCDESILKELLQNADDAKATKICFINDPRQHPCERVFEECWKPLQGPALCVYNDAPFTKSDIEGIQNLGEGNKGDDPNKTGQYGVGFNAVYHLTDAPTFISQGEEIGEVMCVFDPNLKFAPGADPSNPGVMYENISYLKEIFTDVFPCYLGQHFPMKNGTMFRFPLRNEEMANKSKICQTSKTTEDLDKLLDSFKEEMLDVLLFVNNVKEISVCEIDKKTGVPTETYSVKASLTAEDEEKRQDFADRVSEIGKSLRSGKMSIGDIPVSEVSYVLDLEDKEGLHQKWFVVQKIGFENAKQIPENVDQAFRKGDLGLLPRGGVASLINSSLNPPGKAYCFLPLPFKTGLPVHINGHFALDHEARRNLWRDERGDYRSNWNDTLLRKVVAPCYVTLLGEVRELISLPVNENRTNLNCSLDDAETLLTSSYVSLFPPLPTHEVYWDNLAKEVYRYMDVRSIRLLSVVRKEGNWECQESGVRIEWLPPTGQGYDQAFFGSLIKNLPEDYDTFDEKKKYRARKKSRLLRDALLAVGFNLLSMPINFYDCFKTANVNVSLISPADVIQFFGTYNTANQLCHLGSLPSYITNTAFKSVENLLSILKYCKEEENFFQGLQGLPLLLTQDNVLRVFDQSLPVFRSGFYDLLPNSSSLFVHHEIYKSIFYLQDYTVFPPVLKTFDIAAFASLLPKELKEDQYKTTNRYILWQLESDDQQIPSKRWIRHVWRFFSHFLERSLNEYDETQKKTEANVKLNYILMPREYEQWREQQRRKHNMEKNRIIREGISPVKDWCLIPATKAEHSFTNRHLNVKQFLVPLGMAETVMFFREIPFTMEFLKTTLQEMALPELNCIILDGQYEIAKQLVANLHVPSSILSVLLHKLQIDSEAFAGLREYSCKTVLRYFNDHISLLEKYAEDLRVLPFYVTVHGESISISGMQAIVLSDSIPKADMQIWQEKSKIAFLEEDLTLKELYSFLGCDSKNVIDLYCDVIFEKIHEMSEAARLEHLTFLRDLLEKKLTGSNRRTSFRDETQLENKEKLLEKLRYLKFIPDEHGSYKTASSFYDPSNEVFEVMFENKRGTGVFPIKPFCEEEWLPFLRTIGLIHQVSNEQFQQFAKEVEAEAKARPSDVTEKKSHILVKHLFKRENVATNTLLDRVKEICFVVPLRVNNYLQHLHKQYAMEQNGLPYICFKNSVVSNDHDITWTSANLLPPSANPLHFHEVYPNYRDDSELNCHSKYRSMIFRQLQILKDPTVDMVVTHCQNICRVVCQKKPMNDQSDGAEKKEESCVLIKVMQHIYKFLQKNYHANEAVVNELRKIRCLLIDNGKQFVFPNQVVVEFTSDQEIRPYLYKIPLEVGAYAELFENLGTTNMVTAAQYSMVLRSIHDESGEEKLHPNEIRSAFKATKGLFETIIKMRQIQSSDISPLYLPGEKRNPDDESVNFVFLQRSTNIVFHDAPNFKERLKYFQKLLLVKLEKCDLQVNSDDLLVNKLPESIRPRMLTSLVHETLVEGNQPVACSSTAQELREILNSSEFCHGLIRMIRHSSFESDVEISHDILTTVGQKLSCIYVFSVRNLRTRLVYNGNTIPESEANITCFGEKTDGDPEVWKIYVEEGADLKKYFSRVAIIVDRMTGNLLGNEMLTHLTIILSIKPCEIKPFLDELGVREDNFFLKANPSYLPSAGKFIHIDDHHLLVDAFTIFSPGDYVGYELDDPSLRGEEGTPTYIYAIIIEEVTEEGQPTSAEPSSRRYRIDIGKDKEPIIVDAADLYMFKRPENECMELKVYCGPCSDKSQQTETLGEILKRIKRILEDAWKLPKEKRQKIIKRLFLTWHPDKNPGNEEFCTKVFQFILGQIEKLEKGPSFGPWRGSDYSYSGSYSSYFNCWGGRARYHRSQSSSFYRGGGFSTFSWSSPRRNPQPGEARRWYKQAKADLKAASNDVQCERASYEWACFKCHQSAEKALKAAQYLKDADKTSTHSLTALAQELNSSTLRSLASKLECMVGNPMRMRYPDQVSYPNIPHDVYDQDTARRAMDFASRIIQEVESEFLR